MVLGRVGSVTNSASQGVQNEIIASAETLAASAGRLDASVGSMDASAICFGRVGGKFGLLIFGRVGGEFGRVELVPVPKWYRCRCNQYL